MDAREWNERYAAADLIWGAGPNQFVAAELADLAPGRALDLATGEGRNAVWLAERGWRVTAVDFAAAGLAKGAQLAGATGVSVTWTEADLSQYTPDPGAYDLVLFAYLQLPAAAFAPILRSAAAALAPGGTLLVIGHDGDNLSRGHGGPQDASVLLRAGDITASLPDLRIVRAGQVTRAVATDDGDRTAVDTLVRAERPRDARHRRS